MGTRLKTMELVLFLAFCLLMGSSNATLTSPARVSERMGNITFQCTEPFVINGPDCYLLVDVAMTYSDAEETCELYGADLVDIRDEVEAKAVGQIVQGNYAQWELYWIGNKQEDQEDACGGFWSRREPKDVNVTSPIYVAANAPQGRWMGKAPDSRLPFVCRADACVEGTFRCLNGEKCLNDKWVCDGIYDCSDQSDESDCGSSCTFYYRQDNGTLNASQSYTAGQSCTWIIEGPPGQPLTIEFSSLDVEEDLDYVEVWSGSPSVLTSELQARLTGSQTNKVIYGLNNFIIVRLIADLTNHRAGFVAHWQQDEELSPRERQEMATDAWKVLSSPYYGNSNLPTAYMRHYEVYTDEGSVITMEVLKNTLGDGFQYDPKTLSNINGDDNYPAVYVSLSNKFSFYLDCSECRSPKIFQARIKKGCVVDFSRANGFIVPPNINYNYYPPSVTCTYTIRAPQDAQRNFQLHFKSSQLADAKDSVKVFNGDNNSASQLTPPGGYTGASQAPNTTFTSSSVVFVEFVSSLVQSEGFFTLTFNLACPAITNTNNMVLSTLDTQYDTEVTVSCDTGFAFEQEEYTGDSSHSIACGLGGKWNVKRLPTCGEIYCGVPQSINNGFIVSGSGNATYGATVEYQCYSGFTLSGSNISACGNESSWSVRPTCEASQCPSLANVADGSLFYTIGNGTSFGTIVNYTCNAGFDLIGSRYSLCKTGGWSHPSPRCQRISCPVPEVNRASLNPSDPVAFEGQLTVTCNSGFVIDGTNSSSKTYNCPASGDFDIAQNVCVDLDECTAGTSPCMLPHQTCINTEGSYDCGCEEKYRKNGASCEVINRCTEGTSGCDTVNGYCQAINNDEDYVCMCNTGYTLFTANGVSGRYIPSPENGLTPGDVYYINHTCVPETCDLPANISNGRLLTDKTVFDFGDTVEYRCDFGYNLTTTAASAQILTCGDNGTWNLSPPTCDVITCAPLEATGLVLNIYPNSTTEPDDMVLLECNSQSTGQPYNKTLYCAYDNSTGLFTLQGDSPNCPAIDCGSVDTSGGANFTVPDDRSLGATFSFTCAPGFDREGVSTNGDEIVTCQQNGRWGLGNLTCSGARCTDPGTPGGMSQVSASFEVGGVVVYNCTREGFRPNPPNITCVYNVSADAADWDSSSPVCEDIQDPVFTNCPSDTVKLPLYGSPSSVIPMPNATDNSGFVRMTVTPFWYRNDMILDKGPLNVTYTATDAEGNSASCVINIEVDDPEVLPELDCPEYLTLHVNTTTIYTVSLSDYVRTDSDSTLSYSEGADITVGPATVGKIVRRVTSTNIFGFQRQCAFIVDIQPNACLSTYIESDMSSRNAAVSCDEPGNGILNCTMTCNSGFAFQDGSTSMSYDCQGSNDWTPALPARSCVGFVAAKYIYVVDVSFSSTLIANCRDDLAAKLEAHVPTQTINTCVFAGGTENLKFEVSEVQYSNVQFAMMTAKVYIGVTSNPDNVSDSDYSSCALRIGDPAYSRKLFEVGPVTCSGSSKTLTPGSQSLVEHGKSCNTGRVIARVNNKDECVYCEPGNYFNGSVCAECENGKYQNEAGQSDCKPCGNGASYSTVPRLSSDQCVDSCPSGFNNSQSKVANPDPCKACPVDTSLNTDYTPECTACPTGKTTAGFEGATQCIDLCPAGQYPVNNTQCKLCPRGYYKPDISNVACTPCEANETTSAEGSTSSSECVLVTPASCGSNQTDFYYHRFYCICPDGYYGDSCQNFVSACDSSPCYNGGTCTSDSPRSFKCQCPFEQTCSMTSNNIDYDASKVSLASNSSSSLEDCKQNCLDNADCAVILYYSASQYCFLFNATEYSNGTAAGGVGFIKSCTQTFLFEGERCEIDPRSECTNDTCADISFCRDLINGADCVCPRDEKYQGPKCEINLDVCSPNPCKNGATCTDSGNGVRATCDCAPGYTGDLCETDINECDINEDGCLYGGTCINEVNRYTCDCHGYGGDHCQIRPNFCNAPNVCDNGVCYNDYSISSAVCVCEFPYKRGPNGQCMVMDICSENNPCKHNSSCNNDSPGVTSCQCRDGYTGSQCQLNIDDCASNPCVNGTCQDLVNNYTCQCDGGFDGYNCDHNIDDCATANCSASNMVRCEDGVQDYKCVCKVGFTGKDCETNIDECLSLPCQHNGSCSESATPGEYTCSCVDGWTGQNCESLQQYCNDTTCENEGVCFSLQTDFFCSCKSGTFGDTCQEARNLCDILDPCTPASACQVVSGTARCQCPANYTGSSCNIIENKCNDDPCQNNGTCILHSLGHTCQCSDGYSGAMCETSSNPCDSVTCPTNSTCIVEGEETICLCGPRELQSGSTCKQTSNDFDIYFTKSGNAIRSSQPFLLTGDALTITVWVAPLADSQKAPVQLRLSDGTTLLAINKENVTFGSENATQMEDDTGVQSFFMNAWNQITVTWNSTGHYDIYMSGLDLHHGKTDASFPPLNKPIFVYIGDGFTGYISQLYVWQRTVTYAESLTLYGNPKNPSSQDLLMSWSGYNLYDNLWAQLIYPSFVGSSGSVCNNGSSESACTNIEKDKMAPTVTDCPRSETFSDVDRLVQITNVIPNNLFSGSISPYVTNVDSTVLTFGAYRLVFMAYDEEGNAAFCRFSAYVRRQGQECNNTDGLTNIQPCGLKGQTVQCTNNGIAPLSPNILTCGKLGSYNLENPYQLPSAVVCGAVRTQKFTVTVTMKYGLGIDCNNRVETSAADALVQKVKDLQNGWHDLCPDSNCNNAIVTATCDSSSIRFILVRVVITAVPVTLTSTSNVTLTARELLLTAVLELNAFSITNVFNAQLQRDTVVIVSEPSCDEGFGLAGDVCVECTQGSYLNKTTGRCELCPIGSFTNADQQTQCTECPQGQTTLRPGATACSVTCQPGHYLDLNDRQCKECAKNFYQNQTGQIYCLPCPAGKATETNGSSSIQQCYDTCDAGTELRNSSCVLCPRGFYRDGINQETCEPCPSGNTTEGTGSTSIRRCYQTACQSGYFRNSSTNLCEECDYGFYQPNKWQDTCLACNTNYTTENQMSTRADQCLFVCPAGKENLSGTSCTPCQRGFYRNDSLSERFTNCTQCADPFTTSGTGSNSESDCNIRICNAGYYRNETDNMCYECPIGEYQPDSLQTSCESCSTNKTTRGEGNTNSSSCVFYCAAGYEVLSAANETCKPCERGKFKTNVGDAKFGLCQPCSDSNKTTENEASVSESSCNITVCTAGQFINTLGLCEDCGVDYYQPEMLPKSVTTCQKCPNGTGTREDKQTSRSDCKPVCDAGHQYNGSACEPCPMGTWNSGNSSHRFEQCAQCPDDFVTVNEMEGATSILNCTLRNCQPGNFIGLNDTCEPCPYAQYQDIPRQTACKPCRANTNTSEEGSDEAADCTISCAAGKEQRQGSDTECDPCPADEFKAQEGPGQCTPCTGNYTSNNARTECNVVYCDRGFEYVTAGDTCTACPVGKYKEERGNTTQCSVCPTNTTTAGVASVSASDCDQANCDLGFFSPNGSLPCLPCAVGTYKNTTGNDACMPCPDGYTTNGNSNTDSDQCLVVVCPVGQFRNGQNACENCSIGSYQDEAGQTDCKNCSTGYTTVAEGSTGSDNCRIVCPPGQYRVEASNTCMTCAVGYYQHQSGQVSCIQCDAGYTTDNRNSTSNTDCKIVCQAGQYSTSRTSCEPCPYGQYQSANGSSSCIHCADGNTTLQMSSTSEQDCQPICGRGQYLDDQARTCQDCPLGYYNPDAGNITVGNITCHACPDGNTTTSTGATSATQCNILDCNPGYFRTASLGCDECPIGQYQPQKSQETCVRCVTGYTTLKTGRINNASCVLSCSEGQQYNIETGACENCSIGYYRTNTAECVKCPSGQTTLTEGQSRCVTAIDTTPAPVQQRTIRITVILEIRFCQNRAQVGNVIFQFIFNIMLQTDRRVPALCRNRCDNLRITFRAGCLQGFSRGKRQTAGTQAVEVELTGVPDELTDNDTNQVSQALAVVRNSFYSPDQSLLEPNGITFQSVENATSVAQCQQGQFSTNGECENCAAGSYSVDGQNSSCTPCEMNSYQSSAGQSSCTSCPDKTYTSSTGSQQASDCKRKCDEPNADQTYCSGRGTCVFDSSTSDGVYCQCQDNYEGNNCQTRASKSSDQTLMIGAIVGGAGAFLLIVLAIIGIVACLKRAAKKGKQGSANGNGSRDTKHLTRADDGMSEVYLDYNYPFYDNGMRGLAAKPSIMYMNPAADQEVRDFYSHDRSIAPPSRQRSQSYESEWRDFEGI